MNIKILYSDNNGVTMMTDISSLEAQVKSSGEDR